MLTDMILVSLYTLAKQLVSSMLLPRLIRLVKDAESMLAGNSTGAEKKAWLMDRLKEEKGWAKSSLSSLPTVVQSAVVDVLVAWVKTK
jgi:hypothetical protein